MKAKKYKIEKFKMFVCPLCGSAKDVWYWSKGGYTHEELYNCEKCNKGFVVNVICKKCGSFHNGLYGCSNESCECEDICFRHPQKEIMREL
ncbi:hypothetical protein FJ208_01460 [Candidatus Gribaldobacteria bacterium]|nr:hypothetical protein [Candidatus Gribaldobacteria bacterium]